MDEFLLSGFDSAGEEDPEDETPTQNVLKKKKAGESAAQEK